MDPVEEEENIIIVDDQGLDHVIGLEKTIMDSVEEEVVEIITTMVMVVEITRIIMVEEATIIITMAVHQEEERGNADAEIVTEIATTIMETIKTTTVAATITMVEMEVSNKVPKEAEGVVERKM